MQRGIETERREPARLEQMGDIVAPDHADRRVLLAGGCGELCDPARGLRRVGGAEVADDGDSGLQAGGQDGLQHVPQQGLAAFAGILLPAKLRQGERALAQRLEKKERGLFAPAEVAHDRDRGIGPVAGKARTTADQKALAHHRFALTAEALVSARFVR